LYLGMPRKEHQAIQNYLPCLALVHAANLDERQRRGLRMCGLSGASIRAMRRPCHRSAFWGATYLMSKRRPIFCLLNVVNVGRHREAQFANFALGARTVGTCSGCSERGECACVGPRACASQISASASARSPCMSKDDHLGRRSTSTHFGSGPPGRPRPEASDESGQSLVLEGASRRAALGQALRVYSDPIRLEAWCPTRSRPSSGLSGIGLGICPIEAEWISSSSVALPTSAGASCSVLASRTARLARPSDDVDSSLLVPPLVMRSLCHRCRPGIDVQLISRDCSSLRLA